MPHAVDVSRQLTGAVKGRCLQRSDSLPHIRTGPWCIPGAFNIRAEWILLRARACPAPPEGAGLAQPLRCRRNLARLPGKPLGDVVSVEPVFGRFGTEHGYLIVQRQARLGGVRVELSPVLYVLFRPEEIHLPSNAPGICWREDGRYLCPTIVEGSAERTCPSRI